MSKKSGNFFEEHIEKIVLAVIGLVCLYLLIFRVLISPNYVEYEGKKFGPSDIDTYISEQAKLLKDAMNSKPQPKQPYEPNSGRFAAVINSPLSNIDARLNMPLPPNLKQVSDGRKYSVPEIGAIDEVLVEHIRSVAYVPVVEIDDQHAYDQANSEPNDIDFVTVEAKYDVARLAKNFYEHFAGEAIKEQWRDPSLAKPVFAAVQLQRQELLDEAEHEKIGNSNQDTWSDWQTVPRTKIDPLREMFEIVENVDELPPGGMEIRLFQFDNPEVKIDLLQPEAYRIASADEEWFPPSIYKEYAKYQEQLELERKRQAREAEKLERQRQLEEAREARERLLEERQRKLSESGVKPYEFRTRARGDADDEYEVIESLVGRRRPPRRDSATGRISARRDIRRPAGGTEPPETDRDKGTQKKKSMQDFYDKLDNILITKDADITKMTEPFVLWAHDDTVEPGKSYRYRIRIGVFNPTAGTDKLVEQDKWLSDKVILWSDFSQPTEAVEIPKKLYFFPLDIREVAKSVTVRIYKYVLGHWYGQKFNVNPGEIIGRVVEIKAEKEQSETVEGLDTITVPVPKTIDYSIGAVYVDCARVRDWSGGKNLHERAYFDMLYSFDGTNIERRAIKRSCWPQELWLKFFDIQKLEKEPRQPLRPWASKVKQDKRRRSDDD